MYPGHFGLKEKPFSLSPDPRYLYMSRQHWEAMAHLMYGLDDDWGFVLVTGEIGTGKTTLCRLLLEQMPEDTSAAFIINPKVSPEELLASVCDEFRIDRSSASSGKELTDLIQTYLLEQHSAARKSLLIIDEAQYLTPELLDQLRLLTNLETNECKLLRIILLGQPELRDLIARPELEQMSQRITARYHIGPLSGREINEYAACRLGVAGGSLRIFTKPALMALRRLSRGVPRLINVICDRALLGAAMQNSPRVSRSILSNAASEVLERRSMRLVPSVSYALIAILSAAAASAIMANYPGGRALFKEIAGPFQQKAGGALKEDGTIRNALSAKEGSYRQLLALQGIHYDSSSSGDGTLFCSDIELLGMRCRSGVDSSRNLNALQLPAVISIDNNGIRQYATLLELKNGTAIISSGDKSEAVRAEHMTSVWTGEYMMLETSGEKAESKTDAARSGTAQVKR